VVNQSRKCQSLLNLKKIFKLFENREQGFLFEDEPYRVTCVGTGNEARRTINIDVYAPVEVDYDGKANPVRSYDPVLVTDRNLADEIVAWTERRALEVLRK